MSKKVEYLLSKIIKKNLNFNKKVGENMIFSMKVMQKKVNFTALKIALVYCLFAGICIVFSNISIESIAINKVVISSIETMKGLSFVVITTILVFVLVNNYFKLQNHLINELVTNESHFRSLFEHAEISIWNEDLIDVVRSLEQLRTKGVSDLRKYLQNNPQFTLDVASRVKVLQVNDATLKLFGARTENQFLSRIDTTFGTNAMDVFVEELCAIWEGKSSFRSEATFLRFDGKEITAIISFRIPKRVENFVSIPVTILDITDRKEAEEHQHLLGRIIEESLNEIYIFKHNNLKFLYCNKGACQNIGYTLDELIDLTPMDINPQMTEKRFLKFLEKLENDNTEKIFITTGHQRKDGTIYPVDIYVQSIVYKHHNAYLAIIIDITEREVNRLELLDKEKIMIAQSRHAAMGEMIEMIAHQWRQPISVIAMGANNLLFDIDLHEVSLENIIEESESILKQTEYLSRTIDDFKNFFRPDKEIEEVELAEVMAEAQKIIGKSLDYEEITLSIKHQNGYKVKTYSRELLQVYINILKNSKEALVEKREKDRKINVVIRDDTDNVITTISDNGGGIDKSIIENIFNPYYSTKDEQTGTGLGLYMSKIIIEKHLHGRIEVYNTEDIEGVNIGACFKITIPLEWKGR